MNNLLFFIYMAHPTHHRHANISIFILGLVGAIIFSKTNYFEVFINLISVFPPLAAFISGMLFASTFTIASGGLIVMNLAHSVDPIILIIFGGLGAVSCDLIIFYFFKDKVTSHASSIYSQIISRSHLKKILHTPFFAWTLPVVGALIIASPLPDELGVSLLGFSQMKMAQFFFISFGSHLFGMTGLVLGSRLY